MTYSRTSSFIRVQLLPACNCNLAKRSLEPLVQASSDKEVLIIKIAFKKSHPDLLFQLCQITLKQNNFSRYLFLKKQIMTPITSHYF
jgi:hypothetical protein